MDPVKYAEDRYDDAHERWLAEPTRETAERLDVARDSLYRARRRAYNAR